MKRKFKPYDTSPFLSALCPKVCDARVAEAQAEIDTTLAGFETLGSTLLMAKGDEVAVAGEVDASCGWGGLELFVQEPVNSEQPSRQMF
jgi:hypothetical protein